MSARLTVSRSIAFMAARKNVAAKVPRFTAAARTLSLASVARMSDEEAERVFVRLRWADNHGDAFCPHCGYTIVYSCRRPNGAPRWRCKACRKDFSVTSGTLFAFHKMPLRSYLMAQGLNARGSMQRPRIC